MVILHMCVCKYTPICMYIYVQISVCIYVYAYLCFCGVILRVSMVAFAVQPSRACWLLCGWFWRRLITFFTGIVTEA